MMKDPFGTTTISGQRSHSLKLSFGFRDCSISGVSGCTPLAAKNCRGGDAGAGVVSADGAGVGPTRFDFADAVPTSETASALAANATSSFSLKVMNDPSRGDNVAWSRAKQIAFMSGFERVNGGWLWLRMVWFA
jgi:hypothetical protein